MRLIYGGDPAELERGESLSRLSTTIYGVTFPMGAEVDVSHLPEKLQHKLLNNAHFRPAGVNAPAAALVLPVSVRRAEPEAVAEIDEDAEAAEVAALQERLANKPKAPKKRAAG